MPRENALTLRRRPRTYGPGQAPSLTAPDSPAPRSRSARLVRLLHRSVGPGTEAQQLAAHACCLMPSCWSFFHMMSSAESASPCSTVALLIFRTGVPCFTTVPKQWAVPLGPQRWSRGVGAVRHARTTLSARLRSPHASPCQLHVSWAQLADHRAGESQRRDPRVQTVHHAR